MYNVLSAVGWSYVLALTVAHLAGLDVAATAVHQSRVASYIPASVSQYLPIVSRLAGSTHHYEKQLPAALVPLFRRACSTYAVVGLQTSFVQSFALLEVLHSLLGWVRSPLGTTMAQVASRLYLVWGVTALFPEVRPYPPRAPTRYFRSCSRPKDAHAPALCVHGALVVAHRGRALRVLRVLAARTRAARPPLAALHPLLRALPLRRGLRGRPDLRVAPVAAPLDSAALVGVVRLGPPALVAIRDAEVDAGAAR